MVRRTTIALTTALALATTPLLACQEEGPAERAGKAMDEAVEDIQDEVDDAVDEVDDAVDELDE